MQTLRLGAWVVAGVFGTSLLAGTVSAGAAEKVRWVPGVEAAKKEAAKGKKLVMVDFYTDWCGYCKKLDKETYPDPAVVKELKANYVSVKLNAEKEGANLAKRFNVTGYPTILFLTSGGKEVTRIPGYMPPAGFAKALREVRAKSK